MKRYIQRLDEVIVSGNTSKAEELQDEIIAVLGSDLEGLRTGLTNYQPFVMGTIDGITSDSSLSVDFIKDARTLRSRLKAELDKLEPDIGKEYARNNI